MNPAMDNEELRALMDAEARAAENAPDEDDGAPLPDHVTVSRPGHARSRTLQVRLNPAEYEALERVAAERGVPVSTVARAQLLALFETPSDEPLERLKAAAREFALVAPRVSMGTSVAELLQPPSESTLRSID